MAVVRMAASGIALKQSEALVRQAAALDAVQVKNGSVSGEAGANGGMRIFRGPIENAGHASPVRLVPQIGRARFRSGDDEAVKTTGPQISDAGIETADMILGRVGAGHLRQRE